MRDIRLPRDKRLPAKEGLTKSVRGEPFDKLRRALSNHKPA